MESRRIRQAILGLVVLPLAGPACDCDGESTWRETAIDTAELRCERLYECLSATEIETLRGDLLPAVGTTVDECKANLRAEIDALRDPCAEGLRYNTANAHNCRTTLAEGGCDNLRTDPTGPQCCREICAAPASD